jgi:Ca2+-binding RTX toxin-like protein
VRQALTSAVLAAAIAVAVAPSAHAGTAQVLSSGVLHYGSATPTSAVDNVVTIDFQLGFCTPVPCFVPEYRVTDTAESVTAGTGCTQVNTNTADCATTGITGIRVNDNQGNDSATVTDTNLPVTILLHAGNDTLTGAGGDDTLSAGGGSDILNGGAGADQLTGDDVGPDPGPPGRDTVNGGDGTDSLSSGGLADTLNGGDEYDTLRSGSGNDTVNGGAGDDELYGATHADDLLGDGGVDTTILQTEEDAVVTLDGLANDGGPSDDSNDPARAGRDNVQTENVTSVGGADQLTGDGAANVLDGGQGRDAIAGEGGNDTLIGGPAAGPYFAPTPDDDELDGGAGEDVLRGGLADDLLDGGLGADDLFGDDGEDTATYDSRSAPVVVTVGAIADDGGASDELGGRRDDIRTENVTGGSAGDELVGDGGANRLLGGGGSDLIDGTAGEDVLEGASGDDELRMRDGAVDDGTCGDGVDSAAADLVDSVAPDCETVDRPATPSGGGDPPSGSPSGGSSDAPDGAAPVLALAGSRLQRVLRRRAVVVFATIGELGTLAATGTIALPGRAAATVKLKGVRRSAAAGARTRLVLKLSRRSLSRVRAALSRKRRLAARVTVTARDAAGNTSAAARSVKLRR